jgi:hypothetical protein
MLGLAGTASANSPGEAVVVNPDGARGAATWNWNITKRSVYNIDMQVTDTECDGNGVYVQFRVRTFFHADFDTKKRWATRGCGWGMIWRDQEIPASLLGKGDTIIGVWLVVGVNRQGEDRVYVDNPHNPNNLPCNC